MASNPSPVEDISFLTSMLNRLGAAGTVVDTPAAMTRNMLAGRNALSPLADLPSAVYNVFAGNPMDTEDTRATGRQVLTNLFGMSENDPDKWEWQDFAGFGAEMLLDPLNLVGAGWVNDAAKAARTPRLFHGSPVAGIKQFDPAKLRDLGLHAGVLDAAVSRMRNAKEIAAGGSIYGVDWPMRKVLDTPDLGKWYGVGAADVLRKAGAGDEAADIHRSLGEFETMIGEDLEWLPYLMHNDLELAKSHGLDTSQWQKLEDFGFDLERIDEWDYGFPISDDSLQRIRKSPYYLESLDKLARMPAGDATSWDVADIFQNSQKQHMTDTLRGLGYDTLRYPNNAETPLRGLRSYSYAAIDPESVRIVSETPLGLAGKQSDFQEVNAIVEGLERLAEEVGVPADSIDAVRDMVASRNIAGATERLYKDSKQVVDSLREGEAAGRIIPGTAQKTEDNIHTRIGELYRLMRSIGEGSSDIIDPLAAPVPSISPALLKSLALHGGARASAMNR